MGDNIHVSGNRTRLRHARSLCRAPCDAFPAEYKKSLDSPLGLKVPDKDTETHKHRPRHKHIQQPGNAQSAIEAMSMTDPGAAKLRGSHRLTAGTDTVRVIKTREHVLCDTAHYISNRSYAIRSNADGVSEDTFYASFLFVHFLRRVEVPGSRATNTRPCLRHVRRKWVPVCPQ